MMDLFNLVFFGGIFFFLCFVFVKRRKTSSSPPAGTQPVSLKDDPWGGWFVHQAATNKPGKKGLISSNKAAKQYVARGFSKLKETDDNSECLAIPPHFVKGIDPDRPGKLGEEAEETVYDVFKNNQIQGLKIVFFNGQRYIGKKDIKQETKETVQEKDFSVFLEFEDNFYIMFIEVKCIDKKNNKHRKKATSQLNDHYKVLEITHEIPASELDKIMLHSAWPRLSREYTCPKCQNVHYVYQGVPDECPIKNLNTQPEPTYEEPGWHIFKESFGSQDKFDRWIKNSLKEEKAMDKTFWTKILNIHTKHACGALYEEIGKKFLLLGTDQIALRDSPKHDLDIPKFVPGLAGTGKTITTCAMIEKLFKDSQVNSTHKVLYICFSDFLIEFVKNSLKQLECEIDMEMVEFKNYKNSEDIKGFLEDKQKLDQIIFNKQFRFIFFDEAEDLGVVELTRMIGEFTKNKKVSEPRYPVGHFWILYDVFQSEVDTHGLSLTGEKRPRLIWEGKRIDEKLIEEGKKEGIIWPLKTVFRMTHKIVEHINDKCLSRDLVKPEDTGIEGPEVVITKMMLGKDVDLANIPTKLAEILLPVVQDVAARNIHPGHVAILFDTEDVKLVHQDELADVINSLNTLIKNHYNEQQKKLAPEITNSLEESILKTHESLLKCKCKMFIGSVEEVKGFTIELVVYVPFYRSDGITPLFVGKKYVSRTSPYYKAISRSSCEVQIKEILLKDDLLSKLNIPKYSMISSKSAQSEECLTLLQDIHKEGTPTKPVIKREKKVCLNLSM